MKVDDVIYRLNEKDEIAFVNDEWDAFAQTNDGGDLVREKVLSRKLWDFIADAQTGQLYVSLVKRVRSGQPAHFNYRCDSPSLRRFMTMDMTLVHDGMVEFRTRAVRTEARQPQSILSRLVSRSTSMVTSCGWCRKFKVGDVWMEVEEAVHGLRLFEQNTTPKVTHGICEDCDRMMNEKLDKTSKA